MAFAHVDVTQHVGAVHQALIVALFLDIHMVRVGVEFNIVCANRFDRLAAAVQRVVDVSFVTVADLEPQGDAPFLGFCGYRGHSLDYGLALGGGGGFIGEVAQLIGQTTAQIITAQGLQFFQGSG